MMRAARKDYGIPLRTVDNTNGRNGATNGNGHNKGNNLALSRA